MGTISPVKKVTNGNGLTLTSGVLAMAAQNSYTFSSPLTNSSNTVSLSLTATSPVTYSGGTISMAASTSSVNGYLSSTDWSTFNNKQSALTFTSPLSNSSNTVSLSAATTSAAGSMSANDKIKVNNVAPGTRQISGMRYGPDGLGAAGSTGSVSTGLAYYYRFTIHPGESFTKVGVPLSAASSLNVRFAIYNDTNGQPSSLVSDLGQKTSLTTGENDLTITAPNPGVYWIGFVYSGTSGTSYSFNNAMTVSTLGITTGLGSVACYYYSSASSYYASGFPSTAVLTGPASVPQPIVYLKP